MKKLIGLICFGLVSHPLSGAEVTKEFSIGGFAYVQYQYLSETTSPGFLFHDKALYLDYKLERIEVGIDLPVRGGNADDMNFNLATEKAQAFARIKPVGTLEVTVGQFDAIYGFEAADSIDSPFTQNAATASLIPTVHLGAMAGWSFGGFSLRGVITNPTDFGRLNERNPAFGFQDGYEHDESFYITAGYYGHAQQDEIGVEQLYDVMAGLKWAMITFDLQFDFQTLTGAPKG